MYIKLGGVAAYHIIWIDFCLMSVPGVCVLNIHNIHKLNIHTTVV